MPELQSLLLVLLIVYGAECLFWVRLGGVAFVSGNRKRFRLKQPATFAGNQKGGLVLAHPFPPLGFAFVARQFPISLSPLGVFSFVASSVNGTRRAAQTGHYVPVDAIKTIQADGKKVLINGILLTQGISVADAQHIRTVVKKIVDTDSTKRGALIESIVQRMFDCDAIENTLRGFFSRAVLLRRFGNILLFFLFIVAPAVILVFGFRLSGWPLLAALFAQTITIAVLFQRAHRKFFPAADDDRFVPFVLMLLAPASAVRAHDFLARHVLNEFHPLAVARVLCAPGEFKHYARQWIADLRYPMLPIPGDILAAKDAEDTFRNIVLRAAEALAQGAGIGDGELTSKPALVEPETQSYCPRCGTQFVIIAGRCVDCGGRSTVPL